MQGSELLVQTLARAGVGRIYSLSGNQIMPVFDACIDADISVVHTRHEAAAVFMADAHAQLTGEAGVCLVTAGPGAANTLGALYTARQSESAVLLLTGDSPLSQDGQGAFQELDQVSMIASVVKYSFRAQSAASMAEDVARGLRIALSGRPGPVHMALPADVLEARVAASDVVAHTGLQRERLSMPPGDVDNLLQVLGTARAPLVLSGPALGAAWCVDALDRLECALGVPVIAMQSPRGLKDPSLGDISGVLQRADLIVCLGKAVNFTLGFGANGVTSTDCRWIVIDADHTETERAARHLGDRLPMTVVANPADALDQLARARTSAQVLDGWRQEVADAIAYRKPSASVQSSAKLTSATLCEAVQRKIEGLDAETVVISDGGEFGQWSQAITHGNCRLINGPSGAIGGGLCYAIAASKARPGATVFALMGDGTVGFHLAEFETAVRENTPVVVIIGNDKRWNAEYLIQIRDYGKDRLMGCELSDARYDKVVEALGGHGEYVTDPAEIDVALSRAVASGVPACVNVLIEGLPAPSGRSL